MEAALQAPPSPDYVPGPEEPEQAPPSPDYVPGPEHTDDEIVAKDQPDAEDASPTAQSPDYVPESDPEADPEEDDDEDPEEDPVDYSADGGDDGDDEDEPSEEDEDDDVDMEADGDEEERISIPAPVPMPVWSDAEIPSPSLPLSPPSPVLSPAPPPSPIRSLGYRATMIRMRAEAASNIPHSLYITHHPYITSHHQTRCTYIKLERTNPKVTLPPRRGLGIRSLVLDTSRRELIDVADYGFVATMDREIKPDLKREVGYGITDSWDEIVETLQGALVSTDTELGQHMTTFKTRVRQDTDEVYTRLDDEQSQRQLLAGRLNMLFRERRAHAYTRHQMETEARLSQETWRLSMDASDLARGEAVTSEMLKADHRRSAAMRELRTSDRTRQQQLIQTLTVMQSLQREVTPLLGQVTTLQGQVTALQGQVVALQGQVTALQGQVTALQGQQGPAGGPAQPELPEEAGSSS
ncbi:hypothetical protein Tco_1111215 [Tanacetum coccineum]|uniref:Uncharacterized protein n=1 Tax=Tanacetum coccineum TaxID=301880 RepID=A0ABQ5IKZ8_9ASTR